MEMKRVGLIRLAVMLLTRSSNVAENAAMLLANVTDSGTKTEREFLFLKRET